jgi:hypothetical protein
VEEEEKKVIRGGKWGLRLLGVGVWSRLAGTEGVRCRRKERLARFFNKTPGGVVSLSLGKIDAFEKEKSKVS